jgi:hypothetical protein
MSAGGISKITGTKRKLEKVDTQLIEERTRPNIILSVWKQVKDVQVSLSDIIHSVTIDDTLLVLLKSYNVLQQWRSEHVGTTMTADAILSNVSEAYSSIVQTKKLKLDISVLEHNLRTTQYWNEQSFQTIAEKERAVTFQQSQLCDMDYKLQYANDCISNLQHTNTIMQENLKSARQQYQQIEEHFRQQQQLLEKRMQQQQQQYTMWLHEQEQQFGAQLHQQHQQCKRLEEQLHRPENCFCKNLPPLATGSSLPTLEVTDLHFTNTWLQTQSNLIIDNGQLSMRLKENKTAYTEDFRRCCASLMRANVRPSNLSSVLQVVCDYMGVSIKDLPSASFGVTVLHEYAMYGDLEFIHSEQNKPQIMYVDDASQQQKSYQNVAVQTKQNDDTLRTHVTGVTQIVDKSAQTKFEALEEIAKYYRALVIAIYGIDVNEDAVDPITNMQGKVADRNSAETCFTKIIKEAQDKKGSRNAASTIELKCGTHLGSTCSEDAKRGRANHFHTKIDPGYDKIVRIIREVRSNPRAKSFLFERLKKNLRFRSQRKSRFYQNMIYTSDILVMLDAMREFVEFERSGITLLGERKKGHADDLQRLRELLNSTDALTSLFVINIERHKILAPYLELIKQTKTAYKFYPSLDPILTQMQALIDDEQQLRSFMTDPKSNLFHSELVKEDIFQVEGVDVELAITLLKITLACWKNKLEVVVKMFRKGNEETGEKPGPLFMEDTTAYDHILNNNNLGESLVASMSRSVKSCPNGSALYHENNVKLKRNQFPSRQFIMEILSVDQRKKVRKQTRERQRESETKLSIQTSLSP